MQKTDLPALTLAVSLIAVVALAVPANSTEVRMGRHFLDVVGRPFDELDSTPEVLEMLGLGVQLFVRDMRDCQGLASVLSQTVATDFP